MAIAHGHLEHGTIGAQINVRQTTRHTDAVSRIAIAQLT